MIEICTYQELTATKLTKHGMYLESEDGDQILLPAKYVPEQLRSGFKITVFIYQDSQGRPIATTQRPIIRPYSFAFLRCIEVAPFGAFMDWGLDRDLLVPISEQAKPIQADFTYLTYLYVDDRDRITGTTRIDRCFANEDHDLKVGDRVRLMVYEQSELGYKVVINETFDGLLHKEQVQQRLRIREDLIGYVSRIKEDHMIDVSLHQVGYRHVVNNKDKVLEALHDANGYLPLHDKSDPTQIYDTFQISKKAFKKVIGALYKERIITIKEDGIYLRKK